MSSEYKVRRMLHTWVACLKKAHSVLILYLNGADGESGPSSTGSHVSLLSVAVHPVLLFQAELCFSSRLSWKRPQDLCSRDNAAFPRSATVLGCTDYLGVPCLL